MEPSFSYMGREGTGVHPNLEKGYRETLGPSPSKYRHRPRGAKVRLAVNWNEPAQFLG